MNLKERDSLFKKNKLKPRKCHFKNCKTDAIKYSHILQKNGILSNIAENNHLFQFSGKSLFEDGERRFQLKSIGINKVYSFPGFCKKHDNDIFKSIEKTNNIDFENGLTHKLFAYRTICNEIYRKEVMKDSFQELAQKKNYPLNLFAFFNSQYFNENYGIKNLSFFKEELENEIENNSEKYTFKYIKFDKIELCISASLNIYDNKNPKSFENKDTMSTYVTSIFNIFPYNNYSYLLIAQHKDYLCNWTENFFTNFESSTSAERLKMLSDFLAVRTEIWCISSKLHSTIDVGKFEKLFEIWQENISNYNSNIKVNFNIFD